MTNQEILTKAIEKAMSRAWDMYDFDKWKWKIIDDPFKTEAHHYQVYAWVETADCTIDIAHIIFDHDFAKALWGEQHHDDDEYQPYNWCYHLQQMVIAEDPIQYLGENI